MIKASPGRLCNPKELLEILKTIEFVSLFALFCGAVDQQQDLMCVRHTQYN